MLGGFHAEVAHLHWWARLDSNQRWLNRRIYSPLPYRLATSTMIWCGQRVVLRAANE